MPATISTYHTMLPNTRAKASEQNRNFSNHRGTLLPISEDTATASDNAHDFGSSDHRWRAGYIGEQLVFTDAATSPSAPLTGTSSLFVKSDGAYLRDVLATERLMMASDVAGVSKPRPGWVVNLGITYSAGVLTVCAADGSALSASNPGYVALQSKSNPGRLVVYTVTANQSVIDDAGASEIINNLFGTTAGIAWANDLPVFLHAVGNDNQDTIAFMLSRDPSASVSPAAANIGAPDDPVCDLETDFFSLENLDETLYDGNPCLCFGALRMQKSASDDWTFQTLTTKDGVGKFHEDTDFTLPLGQNGADTASHIRLNGGTSVPTFTTKQYTYRIARTGLCYVVIVYSDDAGTDGSGGVGFQMVLPFICRMLNTSTPRVAGYVTSAGAGSLVSFFLLDNNSAAIRLFSEAGTYVLNTFPNGGRTIAFIFTYSAFRAT